MVSALISLQHKGRRSSVDTHARPFRMGHEPEDPHSGTKIFTPFLAIWIYSCIRKYGYMESELLQIFKALADETRLRLLRVVSIAELSVAELVSILGQPQSTVSRHLKPLRDTGLVETRRNGTSIQYRRGPAFRDTALAALVDNRLDDLVGAAEDRASVRRMIDARRNQSREFFDRVAGSYGSLTEPGGGWQAMALAMAVGLEGVEVADLGAGEGALSLIAARYARRVIAVDLSPAMLAQIESRAQALHLEKRISLISGELENLPLPDACVDVCFLSQALHHSSDPALAIQEAGRILRPGGRLVVLDLVSHEHEWVREQFADHWLGFSADRLQEWCSAADIQVTISERVAGSSPDLPVLFIQGTKSPKAKKKG